MKVAIVHDYIKEYGGAEKVLEALHDTFPKAPIYTSVYVPKYLGPHRERFEEMDIRPSFLQYVPFKAKLISPFRLISPFAFRAFNFSDYDVVIVSQTGAYFPNTLRKGSAKLITYTHTPPRYLYGYKTAREVKSGFVKAISAIMFHVLRIVDYKSAQQVDQFIANSDEVASRIEKFYRRDAKVVNPPVVSGQVTIHHSPSTSYYLAGGRLARAKGMDVIVRAFRENGLPIKIFGKGFAGYEDELLRLIGKSKNIELLGEVTDETKMALMASASAYVFASYDEDFGITPVEAMVSGTPVIAYRSGGVKETVKEGETGLFFDKNTPDELNKAITKFKRMKFDAKKIQKHAEQYSENEFTKQIKKIVGSN